MHRNPYLSWSMYNVFKQVARDINANPPVPNGRRIEIPYREVTEALFTAKVKALFVCVSYMPGIC